VSDVGIADRLGQFHFDGDDAVVVALDDEVDWSFRRNAL